MQNIFTWKFWFSSNPPALLPFFFNILVAIVVIFVVAIIVFYFLKRKKSIYQRVYSALFDLSVVNFFAGAIVLFFNYERITFFSARFWLIVWLLEFVVWLIFVLLKLKKIPKKKKEKEQQQEFRKYIP